MIIKAIHRAVEAAIAKVQKDAGAQDDAKAKASATSNNLAVEAALNVLDSPPSNVRRPEKKINDGHPQEYSGIPFWCEANKNGDSYSGVVVRDNKYLEIIDDGYGFLPDRRYRVPTQEEARSLLKHNPDRIVQVRIHNGKRGRAYREYSTLLYRHRKADNPSKSQEPKDQYKAVFETVSNAYKSLWQATPEHLRRSMLPPEDFSKILHYSAKRQSLPMQIRDCHPTVDEYADQLKAERDYEEEEQLVKDATTDWLTIETSTKPIIEEMKYEFPDMSALSFEEKRHLMKMVYRGIESGMDSDEFIDIAHDLNKPRILKANKKAAEEWLTPIGFVHAVDMIVTLARAKKLHLKNINEKGVGISEDFASFVDTTIGNIRARRLSFNDLSQHEEESGTEGAYNQHSNAFRLPNIQTVSLETIVHEASHSYDDSIKRRESRTENEMRADAVETKAELLFESLRKESDIDLNQNSDELWRVASKIWRNYRSKLMKCLGTSAEVISWQIPGRKSAELYKEMKDGYKKELKGESWPSAHLAAGDLSTHWVIWSQLYTNLNAQSEYLGHLYNRGEKATVEAMLMSQASAFHTQVSRMSDKNLSKKMNAGELFELFQPWAVMQSAILYLDPASLARFNGIMERRHIPFIIDQYWTLPEINDGV